MEIYEDNPPASCRNDNAIGASMKNIQSNKLLTTNSKHGSNRIASNLQSQTDLTFGEKLEVESQTLQSNQERFQRAMNQLVELTPKHKMMKNDSLSNQHTKLESYYNKNEDSHNYFRAFEKIKPDNDETQLIISDLGSFESVYVPHRNSIHESNNTFNSHNIGKANSRKVGSTQNSLKDMDQLAQTATLKSKLDSMKLSEHQNRPAQISFQLPRGEEVKRLDTPQTVKTDGTYSDSLEEVSNSSRNSETESNESNAFPIPILIIYR